MKNIKKVHRTWKSIVIQFDCIVLNEIIKFIFKNYTFIISEYVNYPSINLYKCEVEFYWRAEINKDVQNIAKHVTLNIDNHDDTISLYSFYVFEDTMEKRRL